MAQTKSSGPAAIPAEKRMEHLASAVGLALQVEARGRHETNEAATQHVPESEVERLTEDWPKAPKMSAKMLMERYGPPNEASAARLLWHQAGQWKRVMLTRDVYTHHFPMPHTDFLSMTIDYSVPLEKVKDVLEFDGSIIIDRTAGEVTARCDSEGADIITLNLMHDIVRGKRSVEDARTFFGKTAPSFNMGNSEPYMEQLQFEISKDETETLDKAVVPGAIVDKVKSKAKEVLGQT